MRSMFASESPDAGSQVMAPPGSGRGPDGMSGAAIPGLVLREAGAAERAELERFVARRFREVYGASVSHFMPRLFGAYDEQRRVAAVFGLRSADSGPLFLEQYIDVPVDTCVEATFARRATRAEIAEVGNLAGATPGALRALIPALTQRLAAETFRYVAFTGSGRLCNGFARLGLPLRGVAPAPIDRLPPSERARWGRYYEASPQVMIGDVAVGMRLLGAYARHPQVLRAQLAPLAKVGAP